jgi:hypothetical protein
VRADAKPQELTVPNEHDERRGRAVPSVPRDFVEISNPCPLTLVGAPRFVALYPMYDGQFVVNEGQAVYARNGDEHDTGRWLHDALDRGDGDSGGDKTYGAQAVIVDLQTRRAWRAPIAQAIGFVLHMRKSSGQASGDDPEPPTSLA